MPLKTSGGFEQLYWEMRMENQKLRTDMSQAKGILAGFTKSITKMDVFAGLGISAALVFRKIAKDSYQLANDFRMAMREVQTISQSVKDDFEGMSKAVLDLSTEMPEMATGLAKAFYQVVSAGYDGAEALDILRTSAKLGVAAVTDTFVAADALTSVMNAYGEAAGNATNISDKLFTVVKLGKTTMAELGPSITTVTGLAAQMGLGFNDLMAIVAKGVKTLKTDIMMTGIRGILTAIVKPTDEARAMAKSLGIEWSTAAVKAKGFSVFLKDVMEGTKGNSEALAELFPNVRGLTGILAVATSAGGDYNEILQQIIESTGSTEEAFKIMVSETENQVKILKNNLIQKLFIPLGEAFNVFLGPVITGINDLMDRMDALSEVKLPADYPYDLEKRLILLDEYVQTLDELYRNKKWRKLTKEESEELVRVSKELNKVVDDLSGSWNIESIWLKDRVKILLIMEELEKRITELIDRQYESQKDVAKVDDKGVKLRKLNKEEAMIVHKIRVINARNWYAIQKEEMRLENKRYNKWRNIAKEQEEFMYRYLMLLKKKKEETEEAIKVENEWISELARGLNEVSGFLSLFNDDLGESVRMLSEIVELSRALKDEVISPELAVLSGIVVSVRTIMQLFRSTRDYVSDTNIRLKFMKNLLDEMSEVSKEWSETILRTYGKEQLENYSMWLDKLQDQLDDINETIRLYRQYYWFGGEEEAEWEKKRIEKEREIFDLTKRYYEILTGTTVTSIADSIAEGFREGLSSAKVFSQTFGELMESALVDAFKRDVITRYLKDWYEEFALRTTGGLTPEEIAALQASFEGKMVGIEEAWGTVKDIMEKSKFEFPTIAAPGMAGAIAGITEETAELLAGQFSAIRINTVRMLSIAEDVLIVNTRIADNTEYNRHLESIDNNITKLTTGTLDFERALG